MEVADTLRMNPLQAGAELGRTEFFSLRKRAVLEGCKWDPQVGDVGTLANFPLLISRDVYNQLASWAEQLTLETFAIEEEIINSKPALFKALGLPHRVRGALLSALPLAQTAARLIRFDFHYTKDGWRISEANTDVPGGLTESTFFTALMAEQFKEAELAAEPAREWADAIASRGKCIALLAAPGYMEDLQIVVYLARLLRERRCTTCVSTPGQLTWNRGEAFLPDGKKVDAIVRFYQSEWLARSPNRCGWQNFFRGATTPIANPGVAVISESKRFPVVWPELDEVPETWKRLLPETRDPREVNWRENESWILKTSLCNTGDDVVAQEWTTAPRWKRVARSVSWFPGKWVAQRRFETLPIETSQGPMFPCIGIYTIDGRACGAYARLSKRPVVDYAAMDVALLIQEL